MRVCAHGSKVNGSKEHAYNTPSSPRKIFKYTHKEKAVPMFKTQIDGDTDKT